MLTLDVTGHKWLCVDTEDARVSLPVSREPGSTLHVEYRDMLVHLGRAPEIAPLLGDNYGPVVYRVPNWMRVTFDGVVGMELDVSLYLDETCRDFHRDANGKAIRVRRRWGRTGSSKDQGYDAGGILEWPLGSCDLTVWATGSVTLIAEPETWQPYRSAVR